MCSQAFIDTRIDLTTSEGELISIRSYGDAHLERTEALLRKKGIDGLTNVRAERTRMRIASMSGSTRPIER